MESSNGLNNFEEKTEPLLLEPGNYFLQNKKMLIIIGMLLGCCLLVASIVGFLHFQKISEIKSDIEKGNALLTAGKNEEALNVYNEVLILDHENIEALLGKAKVYVGMADYENAKKSFEEVLVKKMDSEKLKQIYDAYIDSEEKSKASKETLFALLDRAKNATGDETYNKRKENYDVKTPSFNLNPGTYQGKQTLEIIKGDPADKIYFSVDGSEPTTTSQEYSAPIQLATGDTMIKAIEVVTNGFTSQKVEGKYSIAEIPSMSVEQNIASKNSGQSQSLGSFSANASSTMAPTDGFDYYPDYVLDQDDNTAWVEGIESDGVGEFIDLTYLGNTSTIKGVSIKDGYIKTNKTFIENGVPTKLEVRLNNNPMSTINLARTREVQNFTLPNTTINNGDVIRFIIRTVSVGPEDGEHDTAITEISLY